VVWKQASEVQDNMGPFTWKCLRSCCHRQKEIRPSVDDSSSSRSKCFQWRHHSYLWGARQAIKLGRCHSQAYHAFLVMLQVQDHFKDAGEHEDQCDGLFYGQHKVFVQQKQVAHSHGIIECYQKTCKVKEDCSLVIEAAIVRIMKARRTLQHQELIGEVVLTQLAFFKPDSRSIKHRIEGLIECEYLEHSADKANVYNVSYYGRWLVVSCLSWQA